MQTAEEKKHKSPAQEEKSEGIEITDLDSFSKEGETEEGSFSFEKEAGEAETAQENDSSSEVLIHMEDITKRFYIGTENELEVLHGISLDVHRGEFTSIVGESGSLLRGEDTGEMDDDTLSDLRGQEIGFVFQTYNLIPRMSALKNVEMPMMYARVPQAERTERAERLLELVGMKERMQHNPDELSGGQKQRVAIARAMANDPALILADEPTGALDSKTGHLIMDLFHKLHDEDHRTILLITHSAALAEETARILTLSDGRIIAERRGTRC